MSENEKKYYLNIQAGANQSQNLAALMRNYGTAIKATADAENEQNSAAKENARYILILQCAILLWQCFRYTQKRMLVIWSP